MNWIIELLLTFSGALCIVGAIGMLRFRDFFSRVHPATIVSVGGVYFAILLLAVSEFQQSYFVKGIIMLFMLMVTDPAITHAITERSLLIEKPFGVLKVNELEGKKK
jgi:multicomponent Na+:H+ antiporter subunit G